MAYSDIHIHALWGCDDGAKSEEQMRAMVSESYDDGVRLLCLTPHFHPGYFGENREQSRRAFDELQNWARERYPQLQLLLGNELRYESGCLEWLSRGQCRTMGNTDLVLVDFSAKAGAETVEQGLRRLLNGGYRPILAHPERYLSLDGGHKRLENLHNSGVLLQIDGGAFFGEYGLRAKMRAFGLVKAGLADFVSSDAHGLKTRAPGMSRVHRYLSQKFGSHVAEALCNDNALQWLGNQQERI